MKMIVQEDDIDVDDVTKILVKILGCLGLLVCNEGDDVVVDIVLMLIVLSLGVLEEEDDVDDRGIEARMLESWV